MRCYPERYLVDVDRLVWFARIYDNKNVPWVMGLHAAVHGDRCSGRDGEVRDLVRGERFDLGANFDLARILRRVVEINDDVRRTAACCRRALVLVEDAAKWRSIEHGG